MTFKPPVDVARLARRGLELRRLFGRGGTAIGVRRAVQLSRRSGVSERTVRRMKAYFDRHRSDKRPGWSRPSSPSAGYIAWLLWGGDAGFGWARSVIRDLDKTRKR